jgi:Tfp pilus assembly protein PilF
LGLWQTNLPLLSALLLTTTLFGQTASQHESSPKAATNESVEVHLGKGYEALKQDRYDDAAENFRSALKVDPTLVMRARFPLATVLFQLRSFTEARHELESVRYEVGERPSICYYFGRLDPEEQNHKSAVANLNKAIAKPPFPDTTYFLGFAYLKQGSDQDAEELRPRLSCCNCAF